MLEIEPKVLTYQNQTPNSVTYCAFSQCGRFFAFIVNNSRILIYDLNSLLAFIDSEQSDVDQIDLSGVNLTTPEVESGTWILQQAVLHNDVENAGTSDRIPLTARFRLETKGIINHIVFGHGDISACRLPHRKSKRLSRVTKSERICIIAVALSTGFIEIYNVDLLPHLPPILAKMVLCDGYQPIEHLAIALDGSLCLSSVSSMGVVNLWDIWDDGNMYATLTANDSPFSIASAADLNEASTLREGEQVKLSNAVGVVAWHPFGQHIFLGDIHGNGLILQSTHPYRCIAFFRHYHRISSACYSRDGGLLLTASFDGSCVAWAIPSYTQIHCYWHFDSPRSVHLLGGANDFHVSASALSPDSLTFATICEDGNLRMWSLSPHRLPKVIMHEHQLNWMALRRRTLAFSSSGRVLAVSMASSSIALLIYPQREPDLFSLCIHAVRRRVIENLLAPPVMPSRLLHELLRSASAIIDDPSGCGLPAPTSASNDASRRCSLDKLEADSPTATAQVALRPRSRWSVDSRQLAICQNVSFAAYALLPLPARIISALCYGFVPGHSSFATRRRSLQAAPIFFHS